MPIDPVLLKQRPLEEVAEWLTALTFGCLFLGYAKGKVVSKVYKLLASDVFACQLAVKEKESQRKNAAFDLRAV